MLPPRREAAMSEIRFHCPACKTPLKVRAELAGKKIKCPKCQGIAPVPAASAAPEAPAAPPAAPLAPPVAKPVAAKPPVARPVMPPVRPVEPPARAGDFFDGDTAPRVPTPLDD